VTVRAPGEGRVSKEDQSGDGKSAQVVHLGIVA
jgi:hypothetical protein